MPSECKSWGPISIDTMQCQVTIVTVALVYNKSLNVTNLRIQSSSHSSELINPGNQMVTILF